MACVVEADGVTKREPKPLSSLSFLSRPRRAPSLADHNGTQWPCSHTVDRKRTQHAVVTQWDATKHKLTTAQFHWIAMDTQYVPLKSWAADG